MTNTVHNMVISTGAHTTLEKVLAITLLIAPARAVVYMLLVS